MNQALVLGVLRHVLQLGAGYAVARGLWKDGDSEILIGAILSLVTFVWMLVDQRKARQLTEAKIAAAQAAVPVEAAPVLEHAAATARELTAGVEQARGLVETLRGLGRGA